MEMLFRDRLFQLVVGIFLMIIIIVVYYKVAQFLKGRLLLNVDQQSVNSGDQITGSVDVRIKRELVADRFYVALAAERQETTHRVNGGTSSNWVEIYKLQEDLLVGEKLKSGSEFGYDFVMETPSIEQVIAGLKDGCTLEGNVRWRVISRLEMRGVDLLQFKGIHVELDDCDT